VWCCDLLCEGDRRGFPLVWVAVLDEFTRECLSLGVHRRVAGRDVVAALEAIVARGGGAPLSLRTDNAAVWRKRTVADWAEGRGVELRYASRGSPWQNGVVESFFARMRCELVDGEPFADRAHARAETAAWRLLYNEARPHGALGNLTPAEFRRRWSDAPE
jgi:transposase InsO family protein